MHWVVILMMLGIAQAACETVGLSRLLSRLSVIVSAPRLASCWSRVQFPVVVASLSYQSLSASGKHEGIYIYFYVYIYIYIYIAIYIYMCVCVCECVCVCVSVSVSVCVCVYGCVP